MLFKRSPLSLAVTLVIGGATLSVPSTLFAQSVSANEAAIPVIEVTALGVDENANLIVAPYNILEEREVFTRGGNLGDLLNGLPGIHSDSFGGGASRPVVRGQTSPRLKVLSDGGSILDASDISPDHAISADPLLAQRIEVLRGPATLLYGGGAIGGAVNILDNKIPTAMPDSGIDSFIAIRGNTVADERAGAASVTAQATNNIALHLEGSLRESDDYKARNWTESRVDGTFSESKNSSIGASWIGDSGYMGLAYTYRDDEYGLPGHNHEYEGCHPHGSALHCGSDEEEEHDHEEEYEEVPVVDLNSRRIDLRGEYNDPVAGIHRIRLRGSHTDYEHHELEEGVISTTFRNKGYEGRIDIDHAPVFGWHGVVGLQFSDTRFSSIGAETFIPVTDSSMRSVFVVEHYELTESWHIEGGARYENQSYKPVRDPRNRPSYDKSAFSWSAASIWTLTDDTSLAATFSRAQRLPQSQELYARGVHLATNTYECGLVNHPLTCGGAANNASIEKETSRNIDLSLRKHTGALTYSLNLFRNNVDGYIFARTLDQYEDFRLIKYTQRDAVLEGLEAEISYEFSPVLAATVFGDRVEAHLSGVDRLPRISPQRVGARVNFMVSNIETEIEYYHVSRQTDVAAFESETPGYNMANISLNYSFPADARYSVFLRGSNLLDEEVWSHTSFLASVIPMPGRSLSAGFKMSF
ncbi:MAG: TonB-dependent receptor [Gammaproteobacteria bacterium]|nr:TonB-dependent receptor [Gammaproteobacteria bacterium]MDP2141870.1 TonB-dependent receptor [Gammaproteobacteria bacterium]MDP2348179.1 TonB-dependent receptor [Gammaproteobacteria bacterium]